MVEQMNGMFLTNLNTKKVKIVIYSLFPACAASIPPFDNALNDLCDSFRVVTPNCDDSAQGAVLHLLSTTQILPFMCPLQICQ